MTLPEFLAVKNEHPELIDPHWRDWDYVRNAPKIAFLNRETVLGGAAAYVLLNGSRAKYFNHILFPQAFLPERLGGDYRE